MAWEESLPYITTQAAEEHTFGYQFFNYCRAYKTGCWFWKDGEEFYIKLIIMVLVTVIGFIGNSVLLLTILLSPRLRSKSINLFIANMSISNALNLFLVAPAIFVDNVTEFFLLGRFACHALEPAQVGFFVVPMLTLLAISVDRFLAISYPFRDPKYNKKAVLICSIIWGIGIGIACVQISQKIYYVQQWKDVKEIMCYDLWSSHDNAPDSDSKVGTYWQSQQIYWFSILSLVFLIPFSGTLIFYIRILLRIKSVDKRLEKHDKQHNKNVLNVAIMVIIVIVTTLICWLPITVYWFSKYSKKINEIKPPQKSKEDQELFWYASQAMIFFHCAIQPIIYFSTGSKLRWEAKRMFFRSCCPLEPGYRNFDTEHQLTRSRATTVRRAELSLLELHITAEQLTRDREAGGASQSHTWHAATEANRSKEAGMAAQTAATAGGGLLSAAAAITPAGGGLGGRDKHTLVAVVGHGGGVGKAADTTREGVGSPVDSTGGGVGSPADALFPPTDLTAKRPKTEKTEGKDDETTLKVGGKKMNFLSSVRLKKMSLLLEFDPMETPPGSRRESTSDRAEENKIVAKEVAQQTLGSELAITDIRRKSAF